MNEIIKQHDIVFKTGEDFSLSFTWLDGEGNKKSLVNKTVYAQLRESPESGDYFDFICSHTGAGGEITLSLTHEQTSEISFSKGVYDVFVSDGTTDIPILSGNVFIIPSVTRIDEGKILLIIAFNTFNDFPSIGSSNRIYLAADTNLMYRCDAGGYYIPIMEWEGPKGEKGDTGNSIINVAKILSEEIVDTYQIDFSNGNKTTYQIVNGRDGQKGQDGNGYFDYDEETELITMVGEIPYQEVSNQSGGYTATIGF